MNKKNFFLFILLVHLTNFSVLAQTGSWEPAGADTSFPRTLFKSADIPAVRLSLSDPQTMVLFAGIYNSASQMAPSDSSDASRLVRSHIAKNAAFVTLLGKKYFGGSVIDLPAEESAALSAKVVSILESIDTDVDRITVFNPGIYDSWQWRSKELIDFAIAYDLLRGAGFSDLQMTNSKSRIQEFAGHLYEESTRLIAPPTYPVSFFDLVYNNHAIMTASAFGMAAVVINNAASSDANKQPFNWINTAMWNLENTCFIDAKRQSEPGIISGYAEGPGYFRYGFLNYLPFMRAMGNMLPAGSLQYTYRTIARSIPNPFYDTRYDSLYAWLAKIRMPDGRLPATEDTFINEYFPELALTGKSAFVWTNSFSRLKIGNSLNQELMSSNTDMRANYIASLPQYGTRSDSLLQVLPISGDLVFRSAFDSNAVYMHVTGKHGIARANSYGHNQADVSSFVIYKGGEILALDPGYVSYTRRAETGNASNHNMILVDDAGPTIGDPQNSNDADGYIENTFEREKLDYGEVRTAYLGADISRKFLFIRKSYFLNADFITSTSSHSYTWQMHGYGLEAGTANAEGLFIDNLANGEGKWVKGSQSFIAHSIVSGGASSYSKATEPHEYSYDSTKNHTAMYAVKSGVANAEFLSALYPYESQAAEITTLTTLPVTSLKIRDSNYVDIAFVQEDTVLQSLDSTVTLLERKLSSNGALTLFSVNAQSGDYDQWFVKNGSLIQYGDKNIMMSDTRTDMSFQQNNSHTFTGYVNKASIVTLHLGRHVALLTGDNILSWTQPDQNYVTIQFSGASYFSLKTSSLLTVKVIPQGFFNSAGYLSTRDTIKILLANSTAPHAFVDSTISVLDSLTFSAAATFSITQSGSYYIVIKHRNSIETWSASPITYTNGTAISYDFTDAQTKAFGSNMIQVSSSPVRWGIYGGDANQDGYIDPLDLSLIDGDSFNYVSGRGLASDINGDGYVDPLDMAITDQNSYNYIGIRRPTTGKKSVE
jgi:hypothetical protein